MPIGKKDTTLRWCVETDDRIGMVRDIVDAIANFHGNVEAMEVVARIIYVRLRIRADRAASLEAELLRVSGVKSVQPVDRLPFEEDEASLVRRVMGQDGQSTSFSFAALTYRSDSMAAVIRFAQLVAPGDMPVLITGESGTGKELMARAIHAESPRNARRFVPVNCAAIPDALLESELFGYAEGAFTGAGKGGRPGLFEVSHGGTLFLDEIGDLSPSLQAKLLRALEDGEIRRVGSTESLRVDVRIVAATNRDLVQRMREGLFRKDLYYRLNVVPIHLPSLRDRREDIVPLTERFLDRMRQKLNRSLVLEPSAEVALRHYDFPGNIRELQNIIERACYLAADGRISESYLWLPDRVQPDVSHLDAGATPTDLRTALRDYELTLIRKVVDETGSIRKAAAVLGVSHTAIANKLRQSLGNKS